MNDQFEGTRSGQRAKRRKTNLILNGLIAIILLLIIIVAVNIFFSGDEKASNEQNKVETKDKTKAEEKENQESLDESTVNEDTEDSATPEGSDESVTQETEQTEEATEENQSEENGEVVETAGGSGEDVKKTLVNPAWEPVGTSQTGEHTAVYDENAADWKEMLQAISSATGIDGGNMTVWRLGNNGPNKSVGTVSAKDNSQKYRVFIEWVDGEGWKPTKVEELK